MITVVLPTFNEKTERLERSVRSALNSIDRDRGDEVIVVNDGGAPVSFPSDMAVRIIDLPENQGPNIALDVGYEAARTEYIARLDVGDVFYPDAKRRQFAKVIDEKLEACFSRSVNELTGQVQHLLPAWRQQMHRDGQFFVSTVVTHRSVSEKVKWEHGYRFGGDWIWQYRVNKIATWVLFDEVTGTATSWPDGFSESNADARRAELRVIHKAMRRREL